MSKTRNNHYVPQWYQEGFFEPGKNTLAYLDRTPAQHALADGRVVTERAVFDAHTSRAFRQLDLYSTFFGSAVNDEIERRLFGDIDTRGANAIRAFVGLDVAEWHHHFQSLFEYLDIQKIRTPKGLDWLKAQYPTLTQNELMIEMQGIRTMHCTIWAESVREIVSAESAQIKFITTDHPVTVYNHAVPPASKLSLYPNDPTIALKASQTLFPLNRDFCLILTNLEYARDTRTSPLRKRTFARSYRHSLVSTVKFIRKRNLSNGEVARFNFVLKSRSRRYIAAGRTEWLYPERLVSGNWADHSQVLLPPNEELFEFGGEMLVRYTDGHVHYQDEFGRTEKPRSFLAKELPAKPPRNGHACGCGSGKPFRACCKERPIELRPSWEERSIRERNLMLSNGIMNVLGLAKARDWTTVRKNLTDDQISKVYRLFEGLWPLETDLLKLLPKPDGDARVVYTGAIHPTSITEFALASSLYFGEIMIAHPFLHAGTVRKDYSPTANPRSYRQEFLKAVVFFYTVLPLVELGIVNLIPDPCDFDPHLRNQMFAMATLRSQGTSIDLESDKRMEKLVMEDLSRGFLLMPRDALRRELRKIFPTLDQEGVERALSDIEAHKENDPLGVLQPDSLGGGEVAGQFSVMNLKPNFEMSMYIAQATGASIATDSRLRWSEITKASDRPPTKPASLSKFANIIQSSIFAFPQRVEDVGRLARASDLSTYTSLMKDVFKNLAKPSAHGPSSNWEAHLSARFRKVHPQIQAVITKSGIGVKRTRIHCEFPTGGIQDNTVNRLLLMSSSERHLSSVPMAFFIEQADGS